MDFNHATFVSYPSPFLNTDCIFVEYIDILRSPMFSFLVSLDPEPLKEIFDISPIEEKTVEELYDWYVNRKERRFYQNLKIWEDVLVNELESDGSMYFSFIETMEQEHINQTSAMMTDELLLNFGEVLSVFLSQSMMKKCFIYTEAYSPVIEKDIQTSFPKATYVYGDLVHVLKKEKITANSTFVFSDIEKILALKEADLLNYSSILIADGYGYNYIEEEGNPRKLVIDLPDLLSNYLFKIDFFNNINKL